MSRRPNKQTVLTTITDLVSNFLYYDRKEDEDLPRGAIEEMVGNGTLTFEEIISAFTKELASGLGIKPAPVARRPREVAPDYGPEVIPAKSIHETPPTGYELAYSLSVDGNGDRLPCDPPAFCKIRRSV